MYKRQVLFASDNFVLPEQTQYFYKLEGFNENWLTSMADMHRVTYTNLAPGTYILKVKATNSDGYAGTEEASLKIVILPPFWMTPWAYICLLYTSTVPVQVFIRPIWLLSIRIGEVHGDITQELRSR